jgi:UDPglucose 6-dehydrogenase
MSGSVIGFAGMTHLGINSAAASAVRGFDTVCFDADADLIARLRANDLPVVEPDLPATLTQHAARLSYSSDPGELARCDVVYIAADVPTDDGGQSDLVGIRALIDSVSAAMAPNAVLVVLCQVPPGFTRSLKFDAARLYYQVETLIFGRAVERALHPERTIVGCANPGQPLPAHYAAFLSAFACPILPMRYESAELAKISINCCLVASVTVANTLAELSEKIGADWSEIAPALKLDRRIGQHSYLAPGLGLAGGNLERDLATVLQISLATGSEAGLIAAFLRNSRHRRHWVLRTLHAEVLDKKPDAVIAVLGLADKENTHSTKNSPSLALIASLKPWRLRVYDPLVPATAVQHLSCVGGTSALDAVAGAHAVAIMTPWPAFREIKASELKSRLVGKSVIDPYRVLDGGAIKAAGLDYFTLGMPPLRGA